MLVRNRSQVLPTAGVEMFHRQLRTNTLKAEACLLFQILTLENLLAQMGEKKQPQKHFKRKTAAPTPKRWR